MPRLKYNDQYHTYWIDGQKATGVSGVAKGFQDSYNIDRKVKRDVAKGMARRPDLCTMVAALGDDDSWETKKKIDKIATDAVEASGAWAKANHGTAKHTILERVHKGLSLDDVFDDRLLAYAEAYRALIAKSGLTPAASLTERFVVYPDLLIAGRLDCGYYVPDAAHSLFLGDFKGLAVETLIPTPNGWTRIGFLKEGDEVFGRDGRPCRVIAKSEGHWNPCYRILFDDKSSVIADHEHRWIVDRGPMHSVERVEMTTEEMAADIRGRSGQRHLRVALAEPLEFPEADLPIDPYVLGAWLGDGKRRDGGITKGADHPMWAELEWCGETLLPVQAEKRPTKAVHRTIKGLTKRLRLLGVQNDKHVPDLYKRASAEQRLALVQGIMDTDGTWNKTRNQAVLILTDKRLSYDVYELVMSLGWRVVIHEAKHKGFGLIVSAWHVSWTPFDRNPFRGRAYLAADHLQAHAKSRRRLVLSVEPTLSVETQCIMVDSPDSTYLCTEALIPTHNSGSRAVAYPHSIVAQLGLYLNAPFLYNEDTDEFDPAPLWGDTIIIAHVPDNLDDFGLYTIDAGMARDVALAALERHRYIKSEADMLVKQWIVPGSNESAPNVGARPEAPTNVSQPVDPFDGLTSTLVEQQPVLDTKGWPPDAVTTVGGGVFVNRHGERERRAWIIERLKILQQTAGALDRVGILWPDSTPTLKQSDSHTDVELDAIVAVIDLVEAEYMIPFGTPDPTKETSSPRQSETFSKTPSTESNPALPTHATSSATSPTPANHSEPPANTSTTSSTSSPDEGPGVDPFGTPDPTLPDKESRWTSTPSSSPESSSTSKPSTTCSTDSTPTSPPKAATSSTQPEMTSNTHSSNSNPNPDEGPGVDPDTIRTLEQAYTRLDGDGRTWIARIAKEAQTAGQPIHLSTPTVRRFEIVRGLVALAAGGYAEDEILLALLDLTMRPGIWATRGVGERLSVLNADEAQRFTSLAVAFTEGRIAMHINNNGDIQLEPTRPPAA